MSVREGKVAFLLSYPFPLIHSFKNLVKALDFFRKRHMDTNIYIYIYFFFFFRASEKSFIPIRNALGYRILGICGSIEHKREQNQ